MRLGPQVGRGEPDRRRSGHGTRRGRVRRRRPLRAGRGLVPGARGPGAGVLSPEDMADAVGWPEFSPPVVTDEARRRGEMYAERRLRQEEARAFGGSRDEFLRYCGTRVSIAPATPAEVPRLHELSVRTHQFNSAGRGLAEAELAALTGSPAHRVATVRLHDRFGDDGLVGGCVVETAEDGWTVSLLMMSCRAMGRGVIEALLAWLARAAAQDGAATLAV